MIFKVFADLKIFGAKEFLISMPPRGKNMPGIDCKHSLFQKNSISDRKWQNYENFRKKIDFLTHFSTFRWLKSPKTTYIGVILGVE